MLPRGDPRIADCAVDFSFSGLKSAAIRWIRDQGHLIEGHPAEVLLDLADETGADLIVVGSRGIRHGTRFLRGSVSSRVASHATTSFLVVHHDE